MGLAVDYCSATAFGQRASLDGRIAIFAYAEGALVDILRAQGMQTTDDLPELIKRFAATAQNSSLFGHRDIIAIEAGDGLVWLLTTAEPQLCDIAITGIDQADSIPQSVSDAISSRPGWAALQEGTDSAMWYASFILASEDESDNTPRARITASGLTGELARPEGIQSEINFAASDQAD
ncbi:MAG: hypothetical protein CL808_03895 [Citromicrobium sp.]|nr:hypothetical protein [Citromicrobium sp.]